VNTMPVNKRSKYRGSRTCGGGTHKNRRGAGNRGGKGRAGHRGVQVTGITAFPISSLQVRLTTGNTVSTLKIHIMQMCWM